MSTTRTQLLLTLTLFTFITIASCEKPASKKLKGKWKGVTLNNPALDSFFNATQHYIDTIGTNHGDAANKAIYGTANMDSLKRTLQQQHDSAKYLQMNSVKNTYFHFFDDSVAVVSFNGAADTGKWHIENGRELIIEEIDGTGTRQKTKMNIDTITEKELKLRFEDQNASSTVTFMKE